MTATQTEANTHIPRTYSVRFPAEDDKIRYARQLVHKCLTTWGLRAQSYRARLITSELVTNAVRHSGADVIHLWIILLSHDIEIRVWDPSPEKPEESPVNYSTESGRGLLVVKDVATGGWGCDVAEDGSGKVTWARLAL